MPKGKRKKGKGGGAWGSADFWAPLARELIGNFAGELMAHKAKGPKSKDKGEHRRHDKHRDIADEILHVLAEHGPRSIAQLLSDTDVGLTPLMRTLRDAREFRLVELVGEDERVQLTPAGSRVARALRRDAIETDGRKLLES